jgi:hypothetical protein
MHAATRRRRYDQVNGSGECSLRNVGGEGVVLVCGVVVGSEEVKEVRKLRLYVEEGRDVLTNHHSVLWLGSGRG